MREYVAGETLAAHIARQQRLSVEEPLVDRLLQQAIASARAGQAQAGRSELA